jgi:hypothetical protein
MVNSSDIRASDSSMLPDGSDIPELDLYQMAEIALQVIDQVTVAMNFDRGADHEDVVRRLIPFAAAQAPERDNAEHARIARWVLDHLINVGSTDRGFRALYGTFGPRVRTSAGYSTSSCSSSS